ncbi:hypothetical protein TIFTF001_038316 [Ficus carica]|uniref:Uncharacterized protein n=1 Tax=Ficus carica TaxID=3494 RepID=A0AA88EBA1_FICCA|nr:hypothetical protein TIFTF001_038304 [Ficus carica]GMN69256.1 hypothetical protein TIFTF001_038307 [Ficus carica]GMN69262.1 hypothetical protein TIFTF001_038313 [Ficus carica]GMN69265.1 hypothetical protein TIFTF001_038316 [Ficus carica]
MEVLASILGALVAEGSRLLGGSIHSKIKYSLDFHRNHEKLEKEIKNLVDLNKDIKNQLDSALKDGRSSPTIEVKRWLREFDAFVTELESLQPTIAAAVDDNRFCGSTGLCRANLRSTISKQMEEMLPEAKRLLEAGSFPNGLVSEYCSVQPVEYIPGCPQVEYQTSAF